uniref:Tetratricopeptide repeat protein 30 n=1 Tax=Syphacia muris TaxID=451379 RepID=A0A0N5AQP2_9BILA
MSFAVIKDGEYTSTIYKMIRDQRYADAIRVLQYEVHRTPNSRAGLSLLGYCYYWTQEYGLAAECYEQLSKECPTYSEYKLYHAQSLYNSYLFTEAINVLSTIDDPKFANEVVKLEAAIKYREEDLNNSRILIEQFAENDPDIEIDLACIDYKPKLAYALALCHYRLHDYSQALKFIADIIDKGIKDHPDLSVGMVTEGIEVRSVGNTLMLHETALIEACNLKAAIEYKLKNIESAREALTDMPPRSESELDPVTLHNQALISFDSNPTDGFAKLQYLLTQNPFPPETFSNLLLLYCKYEYYDLAADALAENAHLTYKYLTQYLYNYIDAVLTQQTLPQEAYDKFDAIASEQENELRKLTKHVQGIKERADGKAIKEVVDTYDETMAKYLPVLMSQAKIYWDQRDYVKVENIFRRSVEFCSENDDWRLNVAHTLFMQENKYKEAAGFYEPIIKKNFDSLLNVSAIVLANLCVCYIATDQNDEAAELMKKVENEEEILASDETNTKKSFHLSIINLVMGTLYCSKWNYEFGMSRIIKAMKPYEKKLGTDTWYYAKRCIVAAIENMAKRIMSLPDSVIESCLKFLEQCEITKSIIV